MNPYRIMLVDDEEEVRKAIIRKMDWEKLGFVVVGDAENGEEALEKLEYFRSQECAAIVEDLLLHAMPQDAEDSLLNIQAQLKLYEDDNAEELLRQLLNRLEEEDGSK